MIFDNRVRRSVPQLNTASLPDLIFTVLFFFMVVTHMRQTTIKVEFRMPQGTQLTRLTKKSTVSYIYIGKVKHSAVTAAASGSATTKGYYLQLNDRIATTEEVAKFISAERQRMLSEDHQRQTVSLKADCNAPMGLITDLKQALRKANVRRINYSADEKK